MRYARLSGLSLDDISEWPQGIELRCSILLIWSSGPQRLDSGNTHAAVRRNFLEFPVFRAGMRGSIFDPEADREERVDSGEVAWRISCPPSTVGLQGAAKHYSRNS